MKNLIRIFLLLSIAIAAPLFARNRAVSAPSAPILYSATVVDDATGHPVIGALVSNGKVSTLTTTTGAFVIPVYAGVPTTLTLSRSGYETTVAVVTAQPGTPGTTIKMKSKPGVTVVLNSGATEQLDFETVNFVFAEPLRQLQGPSANFCTNGTVTEVDRSQISRILGPATRSSGGACCNQPVLWLDVELKTGERTHSSFVFDCYTYLPFFGGRDHETNQPVYLKYEDIKEIDFP